MVWRVVQAVGPFGPIFGKEMRISARRKRSYLLRVGYLGFLLLLMFMVYSSFSGGYSGAALRSQRDAEMGAAFFLCFSMFSIWAMGIIGPVLTSTSVGSERLQKTLHVLLMTPISAWQIVSGKLFSRLLIAMMLLGLSLPVLAVVRLLGGVEIAQMFSVVCVAASLALSTAAIGLFFSVLINRAYAVILLSYAVQFVLYGLVPIVLGTYMQLNRGTRLPVMAILGASNPYIMAPMLGAAGLRGGMMMSTLWIDCVAVQVSLAFVLLLASAAIVRRMSRQSGELAGPVTLSHRMRPTTTPPTPSLSAAPDSPGATPPPLPFPVTPPRPPALIVAPRIARPAGREVGDNPILWREVRRPLMSRLWQRVLGATIAMGILLFSYLLMLANNALSQSDTQIGYAVLFNGAAWLMASVISATAIATEKESDTWTLLMATPISSRAIVWGKTLGTLRRLQWPAAIMLAHFLLFWICGIITFRSVLLVVWVFFSFNSLWIATGIYYSLRMNRTTSAVVFNMLLAPLIYGLPFGILMTIDNMMYSNRLRGMEANVGWYFPYYYLGAGFEGLNRTHGVFGKPSDGSMTGWQFFRAVVAMGSLYMVLAVALLHYTAHRLNGYVGRARQRQKLDTVAAN